MNPPLRLVPAEPGLSRYASLAQALRARVVAGEWPPGSALPAESQLASEHSVALGTMRRALELLVEQGFIERIHGKGTFVRQGLAGASMLRFFRFDGGTGEVPLSRILQRSLVSAPAAVSRALGIGTGEPVLRLHRLRLMGGQPCLLEELWLPLDLFEPLADDDLSTWDDLLYPMFARRVQVHVHRALDDIGFAQLSATQARHLGLPAGHPCAQVQRSAFDLTGRCVELRTTRGDAHAFHYTVTIT
ncbi:GntR family transcriptional regulator [Hydrogenophaga taeniospiralis CCUG 15921]|uniref:GntR family transcriptional regulator n=1 Tax=Hydrogenophaga taeniospiralis CCUG 15921 TaxID=1281780 RepID=A0A9X4S7D6_9BURK|nr:GntR family transcriptional regulator [Hydrogenophaga taeniospiralis]MDG5975002.1 GntR family transcriptional regulator [Hydrogenophaga taeniospiralis CCUG 15921]